MTGQELPSILLIDDNQEVLEGLRTALLAELGGQDVVVKTWQPQAADVEPLEKLSSFVDGNTILVATDFDLTSGIRGLFGPTIVGWCQGKSVPVGDFSRGNQGALPKEPNLFELRVPADNQEGAHFIASTFDGFKTLRDVLASHPAMLESNKSLAEVLAAILGVPAIESQFAQYMSRLGASNSFLLDKLVIVGGAQPPLDVKLKLLAYVLGHVLLNAILKYPGPILSERALCAYVAASTSEIQELSVEFQAAVYEGPFSKNAKYFWRHKVDEILDGLDAGLDEADFESFGDLNRKIIEKKLGRNLADHPCDRCGGKMGGFLCPFTQRPVCLRQNCSVSASSWIPEGAQLCRVEKDFYDEWAPLLGL